MTLSLPAGTAGFPANTDVTVSYLLNDNNELVIDYQASVDQPMPVNFTQHSYFNLNGDNRSIRDHSMMIYADHFLAINSQLIPQDMQSVTGTVMDFRKGKLIGTDINADNTQIQIAKGYDHCWCLDQDNANELKLAARVSSPTSGLAMEVYTNQTGIQFYSGNFLEGEKGRRGHIYQQYDGFCLETQCHPDQVNRENAGNVFWSLVRNTVIKLYTGFQSNNGLMRYGLSK